MITFRCKKCLENTVNFNEGDSVGICGNCGKKQILPNTTNSSLLKLFNEADNLLLDCDFDGAEVLYNRIILADSTQSEAYLGLVLCRYCIGFIDDECVGIIREPSFKSVTDDEYFKNAVQYADDEQKEVLLSEAEIIDRSLKEISDVASSESLFDVFICCDDYDNSNQTQCGKEAKAIYNQLKKKFRVFYAPETLGGTDKTKREYLTHIFAAVSSARLMLVIGSERNHFSSGPVKAVWSGFLALKKADSSKMLIPCYMNMKAEDLPDRLAQMQAEDITETDSKFELIDKVTDYVMTLKLSTLKKIDSKAHNRSYANAKTPHANPRGGLHNGYSHSPSEISSDAEKKYVSQFRNAPAAESFAPKNSGGEQKSAEEPTKKKTEKSVLKKILAAVLACCVIGGIFCFNFLIKPSDSYKEMKIRSAKVGDYVSWGYYEQDGKEKNGKEPIEWQVIDKNDKGVLLISRYALDSRPYDTTYSPEEKVTWSNCSLVSWLNSSFADDSFNDNEREKIQETIVYDYDAGEYFHNKIFLLDAEEVRQYFPEDRLCSVTKYAAKNGTEQICSWWLRDGESDEKAGEETDSKLIPYIDVDGNIHQYNGSSKGVKLAVRPAMWVNVEK